MEIFNLQLLFKENNNIILDFLKNDFINILKDGIIEDIKIEIYKLLLENNVYKKEKSKICGFRRSRKRGSCRRLTNYILCPYHLQEVKKEYENISLPDKNPSGNSSGLIINIDKNNEINENIKKDNHENNIYNNELQFENYTIDINNSYYIEYINYLNNIYYDYDEIVYANAIFDEEIKILNNIDYDILIDIKKNINNEDISSEDNTSINEKERKIIDLIKLKNKKNKKNKKKKKTKPKTLEKKFDIFNDKIKNFIRSYNKLFKEDSSIIVKTINNYLIKYKNNEINLSSCGYHIFDDTYDYINEKKHKYDNPNVIVNLHKKVIIYYKMFSIYIDEKEDKWLSKIDDFMENKLKDF